MTMHAIHVSHLITFHHLNDEGGHMARLSVAPRAKDGAKFATFLDEYERRVEATPPGMCAVAMQLDLLRAGGCQTCGKGGPCREGIAHIETLL